MNKKSPISHSVLEKIQKEKLQPRSRWYFIFKHLLIGSFSIAFIILGLIACTMIFQFLSHLMIVEMLIRSPYIFLKLLWIGIPLFWVILWIGLFGFGTVLAHESKRGYKIAWSSWALLILTVQVVGGFALYQSEIGDRIDQFMGQFMRQYERAEARGARMWRNPENGFLGGEVLEASDDSLKLKDRTDMVWSVDISKAHRQGEVNMSPGSRVRCVGEKAGEKEFTADLIANRRRRPQNGQRPTRQERQERRRIRQKQMEALPTELQEQIKAKREAARQQFESENGAPLPPPLRPRR